MIVPVRKDPEALPACQDNVDIHPEYLIRLSYEIAEIEKIDDSILPVT